MSKVIKGGTIVTAEHQWKADVLIEGGHIAQIGEGQMKVFLRDRYAEGQVALRPDQRVRRAVGHGQGHEGAHQATVAAARLMASSIGVKVIPRSARVADASNSDLTPTWGRTDFTAGSKSARIRKSQPGAALVAIIRSG